ncbi:DnaJ domain-containing protein [Wuchereria bancrofti]|uniref:DnaJ domain-containing protein n=2 Tax=Wuchereria bancrofti TaxID=6293 RepID=J9BGF6_WUCBA|nr:DnaJ domain-containing protein [Wuchereria bancrofti]
MEANRAEAQRCVDIARDALRGKDSAKAVKFLHKAAKLDPTMDVKYLLKKAETLNGDNDEGDYHATGTDTGYGHYDQYEADSDVRSRRTQFHTDRNQSAMNGERGCPDGADEGSSSSAAEVKQRGSRSRSSARPKLGVHYTKEELEIVERIRHCKDYYEILNLKKNAKESDLKREYRKLALQLHPDKCRAPGATEAFKALGNAYAVLSNKDKRAQYDLYGAEGPRRRSNQYEDEFSEYDYGRGFEAEFTPEEIFNMFFGGGYPAGHINRRQRGAQYHFHQQHSGQQDQSPYAPILQLLPLFAVLFLGLIAQLMVGDPAFSLHRTGKYTEERFTKDLQVPYYVKTDFLTNYRSKIAQIEHQVEDEYVSHLRMKCYRERNERETALWRARTFGDADLWNRAQRMGTPSCDRLQEIYS